MTTNNATGRVAGKRVLITGAARGMGRSHAVRLAEEGADCILVDICSTPEGLEYPLATEDDLNETAKLVEKHGRRAITAVVDVRDEAAMKAAVDAAVGGLGGLDGAVANAGVLTVGTWDTTTAEQWRLVVDVNLIGAWNTCAAALPTWSLAAAEAWSTSVPRPASRGRRCMCLTRRPSTASWG